MSTALDPIAEIDQEFGWSADYDYLWEWVQSCIWIALPGNENSSLTTEDTQIHFAGALLEFDQETNRFVGHMVDDEGSYYIFSVATPETYLETYSSSDVLFDIIELEYVASRISVDLLFWIGNITDVFASYERRPKP